MPESVLATRTGLNVALTYTLPFVAWLLGQSFLSSFDHVGISISLEGMVTSLFLVQSCALAVCLPWLMRFPTHIARCCGIAMLLLVPGPLYAITWLAGAAEADSLVLAMLCLVVLALLLYGVYTACLALTSTGQYRSLLLLSLQLALVGLCWNYKYVWLQVLSL